MCTIKLNVFYHYHFLFSLLSEFVDINGTQLRRTYLYKDTHFRNEVLSGFHKPGFLAFLLYQKYPSHHPWPHWPPSFKILILGTYRFK